MFCFFLFRLYRNLRYFFICEVVVSKLLTLSVTVATFNLQQANLVNKNVLTRISRDLNEFTTKFIGLSKPQINFAGLKFSTHSIS